MEFSVFSVVTQASGSAVAADIFLNEMQKRGIDHVTDNTADVFSFHFCSAGFEDKDTFSISFFDGGICFSAVGIRGFIYAVGMFLRKCEFREHIAFVPFSLPGRYQPQKKIRGHQLGYRHCANTYDAWTRADFYQYDLDLMFFGANTVEHIPQTTECAPAPLMRELPNELLKMVSEDADSLDLDVSLWIPNDTEDIDRAVAVRKKIFEQTPRIDAVFIPGSDPGSLPPDALRKHCDAIALVLHETHPAAGLWPSAQAPHDAPEWGEAFLRVFEHDPGIAGVITGPNHAFEIEDLRERLPQELPIRFYPDITHNVRCEYPVHFLDDDWHYAFAACLSRECINPRPAEYALLHKRCASYTVGSVSYSEGVNDDVNKAVWSALEWNSGLDVRDILADYSRLFFYGASVKTAVDALLALEQNWSISPDNNPQINHTLALWEQLGSETPALYKNWRFVQCLFRAVCDDYIRCRMLYESSLVKTAESLIRNGELGKAGELLRQNRPESLSEQRERIDSLADQLNALIGLQLSVERHGASGWERGATLDTIDLPITDLEWLRYQLEKAEKEAEPNEYMMRVVNRNHVNKNEWYFSFALHGFSALGCKQNGTFYMDFQGDRPNVNNGTLPVCLQKLYDHTSLRCMLGGFACGVDYVLSVTYKNKPNTSAMRHRIMANNHLIYEGPQFGGQTDAAFSEDLLPEGFIRVQYDLPAFVFNNGCLLLEISEPTTGFEAGELFITKKEAASFGS